MGLKYGDWVNRMKRKSLAPKGGTWWAGRAKGSGAWHRHGAPRWRAAAAKLQTVKCPGAELAFPRCFGDESEPGVKDLLSPALFFPWPGSKPGSRNRSGCSPSQGRQEAVSPPRCCVSFSMSLNFSVPITPTDCLSVCPVWAADASVSGRSRSLVPALPRELQGLPNYRTTPNPALFLPTLELQDLLITLLCPARA